MNENSPVLIADIEARIEHLRDERERARKAVLLGRIALWGGAALLLCVFGGFIWINRVEIGVAAFGLLIGGIVFAGSSRSTAEHLSHAIGKLEAARAEAIDQLDLEFVQSDASNVHRLH